MYDITINYFGGAFKYFKFHPLILSSAATYAYIQVIVCITTHTKVFPHSYLRVLLFVFVLFAIVMSYISSQYILKYSNITVITLTEQ